MLLMQKEIGKFENFKTIAQEAKKNLTSRTGSFVIQRLMKEKPTNDRIPPDLHGLRGTSK